MAELLSGREDAVCEVPRAERNLRVPPGLGLISDGPTVAVGQINRRRLKELMALAHETVDWLESKGLKQGEQCVFRQIAENIWFSPK